MNVLYFDDECVVCNTFAMIITRVDRDDTIYFASIRELDTILPEDMETAAYYSDDLYLYSDGVIEVLADMTGMRTLRSLKAIPKGIRDGMYKWVSRNRHKLNSDEPSRIDHQVRKKMVSSEE